MLSNESTFTGCFYLNPHPKHFFSRFNLCFTVFKGLFEILDKFDNNTIVENNTLTRCFEECDRYLVEVDNNPDTYEEERKYFNGTEMHTLASTLSDRLQLNVSDLTSGWCCGLYG